MQGLVSLIIIKKKYIYPLSHLYLSSNCTNPLTLKCMLGPRDNGDHLMGMHMFWYDGLTVDLQSPFNICAHVGFSRGRPL